MSATFFIQRLQTFFLIFSTFFTFNIFYFHFNVYYIYDFYSAFIVFHQCVYIGFTDFIFFANMMQLNSIRKLGS